jgi:antitoxin component YwqK of YwqJK toxin-antitoxin module
MSSKLRFILLALLPVFTLLSGCKDETDLPIYPSKTEQRLELPGDGRDEEVRYVDYARDGVTPLKARVEYRNGNTAYATYHENGKVKEWREFYPASPDGNRQLRLHAELSPDEHYKTDELYREDGSLARLGREVNRVYYDASWFFEDGRTVSRHKKIQLDAEKTVFLDEHFRPSGTLLSQKRLYPDAKLILTTFSEDGKPATRWTTNKNYRYGSQFEQFYPDGVKVRVKAEYTPMIVTAEYMREDGSVEQVRVSNRFYRSLEVALADRNNQITRKQIWRVGDEQGMLLRQIADMHNGKARFISFYGDGKTPQQVESEGVVRHYRADGTLESEVVRRTGATRKFAASENIRLVLPASYFVDPPHEEIPAGVPADL